MYSPNSESVFLAEIVKYVQLTVILRQICHTIFYSNVLKKIKYKKQFVIEGWRGINKLVSLHAFD